MIYFDNGLIVSVIFQAQMIWNLRLFSVWYHRKLNILFNLWVLDWWSEMVMLRKIEILETKL